MPFHQPDFLFNSNFGFSTESVFVQISELYTATPPPIANDIITETGINMISETGSQLITE